jgi:hypothetical protein
MKIEITDLQTTVTFSGDLAAQAPVLRADLASAMRAATGKLVVDLTACTSLGVAGLGLVFGIYRGAPWGAEIELRARRPFIGALRLCFGRRGAVLGPRLTPEEVETGECRLVYGAPPLFPEAIVEVA